MYHILRVLHILFLISSEKEFTEESSPPHVDWISILFSPFPPFFYFCLPSEHNTQYAAEIILCWMKFGHKSRADLLRPLHSQFPSLLSTWQFKSLITLTRNPFPAGQSRPVMSSPSCTWAAGNMVLSLCGQPIFTKTQEYPVFSGKVKAFPHAHCFFPPASAPKRQFVVTLLSPVFHFCPLLEKQENTSAAGVTS